MIQARPRSHDCSMYKLPVTLAEILNKESGFTILKSMGQK